MHYRTLGKSGIRVSLASYGAGGPSQFGKAAGLSARQRRDLIARAIDLGINLFDTAANYGDSEIWLGEALTEIPRDAYLVATKWSWKQPGGELPSADSLTASVERSLQRFHTDVIDIMQIHGVTPEVYEDVTDRYAPTLSKLKEQGKVRLIGVTEMMTLDPRHTMAEMAVRDGHEVWHCVMLKYGILNQCAAETVLPLAQRNGVAILNMAPVRFTLTRADEFATLIDTWCTDGEIDVEHPKIRNGLDWLIDGNVPSVIAAGYKFAAAHPAISTVISGTANIHHLEDNVAALREPSLPEAHMELLNSLLGQSAAPR